MPASRLFVCAIAAAFAVGCANFNSLTSVAGENPPDVVKAAYESFHAAFPDGNVADLNEGGLSIAESTLSASVTVPAVLDEDAFEPERVTTLFKDHAVKLLQPLMVAGVETLQLTLHHKVAKKPTPGADAPEATPAAFTLEVTKFTYDEWRLAPDNLVKFYDRIVAARGVTLNGKVVSSALR
jgi:hypothetical protein